MRKIILLLAALSLGGCANLPSAETIKTAIHFGTASVANPVTPERLNLMENGAKVLFAGLNAWKQSCVQGLINATCKQQIRSVQIYTLQIKPYLVELRQFVRNNDQVNAITVFNQLTEIIGVVKSKAAAGGQTLSAGEI